MNLRLILACAALLSCLRPALLAAEEVAFLVPEPLRQDAPGFVVYQSAAVPFDEAGIAGSLQILQDARVTPAYSQSWGASADPAMALGPDDPWVKSVQAHPLQNGRLRLVGRDGHVVTVAAFGEPLAQITTTYLYGNKFPTYLVAVDYGIGMGSYAGPATTLVEVRGGRLTDLPIVMGRSLKNDWRIVAAAHGAGKEIEVLQCHPNFKNPNWAASSEFVIDYETYCFGQGKWREQLIEKIGFWEADDDWPPRSAFP